MPALPLDELHLVEDAKTHCAFATGGPEEGLDSVPGSTLHTLDISAGVEAVRLEPEPSHDEKKECIVIIKSLLLCEPPDTCCPSVEFHDDDRVTIGENDAVAVLTRRQWELLVAAIRQDKL